MARLGMANPPYLLKYIKPLCKLFNHPNMYAFAHIPVQSGSDKVLVAMKRGYTQNDFRLLVDELRKNVPGLFRFILFVILKESPLELT
jgi:threonylcarbamoyladenosine tRNA methylthiotransferase CDKAL1